MNKQSGDVCREVVELCRRLGLGVIPPVAAAIDRLAEPVVQPPVDTEVVVVESMETLYALMLHLENGDAWGMAEAREQGSAAARNAIRTLRAQLDSSWPGPAELAAGEYPNARGSDRTVRIVLED